MRTGSYDWCVSGPLFNLLSWLSPKAAVLPFFDVYLFFPLLVL